jgi:hypothetical protein
VRRSTLRRNPKTLSAARSFHLAVFAIYGSACILCWRPARDAAHVIARAKLGKLRFADPALARPLCRNCHILVDTHQLHWPKKIYQHARTVHNALAKIPLPP